MKVQDEGLAGEGSRRRFTTKAWLEKVLDEGPGRRPRTRASDGGLLIVLYKGFVEKAP